MTYLLLSIILILIIYWLWRRIYYYPRYEFKEYLPNDILKIISGYMVIESDYKFSDILPSISECFDMVGEVFLEVFVDCFVESLFDIF